MIKIALPNKGALAEEAARLMTEAGYCCRRYARELWVYDKDQEIDFVFLRPRDIAVYVDRGLLDLGITGRDLAQEADVRIAEVLALGFGRSKFCYAVPKASELTPDQFTGLRIATSFPHLVRSDLARRKIEADIIHLEGAVEISVNLGVADVIADVVETGRTLKEAGLTIVGPPLLRSEAVAITAENNNGLSPQLAVCIERLRGVVVARDFVMVEYDAPEEMLEKACTITPGIESPTISPLSKKGWVAVKAMVKRNGINDIMDQLSQLGAKGIIVSNIQACRL